MSARCVRPDCDLPAAARLAAHFEDRVGWLCDLDRAADPHDYLLCARHADALTLPMSWELHDERTARVTPLPPRPTPPPTPPIPTPDPDLDQAADELQGTTPADSAHEPPEPEPTEAPPPAQPAFEYDPATDVDESTPLLSRAFRAAASGTDRS